MLEKIIRKTSICDVLMSSKPVEFLRLKTFWRQRNKSSFRFGGRQVRGDGVGEIHPDSGGGVGSFSPVVETLQS